MIEQLEAERDHLQRGFNAAIATIIKHEERIATLEEVLLAILELAQGADGVIAVHIETLCDAVLAPPEQAQGRDET